MSAYVALLEIDLHFPDAGSLKDKRKELASVKALLQQRHGMPFSQMPARHLQHLAIALLGLGITAVCMAPLKANGRKSFHS